MYTIEFQTKIENGTIRVPKKVRQRLQEQGGDEQVRVIIQISGQQPRVDYIDRLLANPIRDEGFVPLGREEAHERV
jgi:hypothetical protein